jgi:hypothetical protein
MDVDDEAARVVSSVPVGLSSERTDALSALADASPLRTASSVP